MNITNIDKTTIFLIVLKICRTIRALEDLLKQTINILKTVQFSILVESCLISFHLFMFSTMKILPNLNPNGSRNKFFFSKNYNIIFRTTNHGLNVNDTKLHFVTIVRYFFTLTYNLHVVCCLFNINYF